MTSSGTTVRKVAAVTALVLGLAGTTASPGGSAPSRPPRAPSAPVAARLLVPLRVLGPDGVDVGADGTVYAVEAWSARALAQHADGTSEVLPFTGLEAPQAIAVDADGTVYVGDGDRIVSLTVGGTQADLGVTGLGEVTALDVDPADGSLLVADPSEPQVLRITPDGTRTEVDLAGTSAFAGVAAGAAGDVLVIDTAANDVVVLHPDGTSDPTGFTTLRSPAAVAFRDGTTSVAQPAGVVQRDDAAVESTVDLPIAVAGDVAVAGDGTVYATTAPAGTCRCPEGPGSVLRHADGTTTEITFGDVAQISAVAATAPGTVVFASSSGPLGYSDPNPLREVRGDGPATDLDTGGATGYLVAGAPDGTLYLSSGADLVRITPGGGSATITLPTEPGQDQVVGLAVDETGRLFVVLGSGYGSGPFQVVEPVAGGSVEVRYRSTGDQYFQAVGAGGGTLQVAVTDQSSDTGQLLVVGTEGKATARLALSGAPVDSLTVDAAGVAYLLDLREDPVRILVVPPTGEPRTLAYAGQRAPRHLSMGTDGTLYVDDAEVGLLALPGVGTAPAATPPPAVPVPGAATYTG